ncbi:hypothetical protein cco19_03814, partial [Campylobacter coli 1091]
LNKNIIKNSIKINILKSKFILQKYATIQILSFARKSNERNSYYQ